jgi:hypothetical protein
MFDLAEFGLAHLLAGGTHDMQPVAAGGQCRANGWIEDCAPPCGKRRIPECHRVLCSGALEARALRHLAGFALAFFALHLRALVGAGCHALHHGKIGHGWPVGQEVECTRRSLLLRPDRRRRAAVCANRASVSRQ